MTPNLEEVKNFLERKGYLVESIQQPWRFINAELKQGVVRYYFKMATSEDVNRQIISEVSWNNFVAENKTSSFHVPEVIEIGAYENLNWYICEFVEGEKLGDPENKKDASKIEENIPLIAKIAKDIVKLPTLPDNKRRRKVLIEEKLESTRKSIDEKKKDIKENIDDLMALMVSNIQDLEFSNKHGDFVPWHIIKGEKTYLIDGEWASRDAVKLFDVAYCYHRIFTTLERPDLADKFLKEFQRIYRMSKKDKKNFMFTLASRTIGGLWESYKYGWSSVEINRELKERVLKGKILS